jgi:uncharacterized membrane protein (GlpM family)
MIELSLFTVVKVSVSILVVVLLSLIAEWASPRIAGIASGYPLGAAISLYFIGLENGSGFAARSALFTAAGLAATIAFVGGYLLGIRLARAAVACRHWHVPSCRVWRPTDWRPGCCHTCPSIGSAPP